MKLLPAIDLMDGCAVRLRQGKAEDKTIYSKDPAAFALKWQNEGGDLIHIVDLDGAFQGKPMNLDSVRAITSAVNIPCELGGGMRTPEDIEAAFQAGVARVILGSKACEEPIFVEQCLSRFGPDKIVVGIDAKDGHVATRGWVEQTKTPATTLAQKMFQLGVRTLIYTDIATDGMLRGPNIQAMSEMVNTFEGSVIASGGVSCMEDILNLNNIQGIGGVILGKALYEGLVDLKLCRSNIK